MPKAGKWVAVIVIFIALFGFYAMWSTANKAGARTSERDRLIDELQGR